MTTTTLPASIAPGVHFDMPADAYHSIDACSASRLKAMRRSALHCRHSIDNPATSAAMELGTALHCCVLTPILYASSYCVAPECDRRTKEGKSLWSDFAAANAGKTILRAEDAEIVTAAAAAIRAHPSARELLDDEGETELTLIWRDHETGCPCKARLDKLARTFLSVADLKTITDASPEGFRRAVRQFGYHIQCAWYLAGCAALDIDADAFGFVAVETAAPFGCAVYDLDDEAKAEGHDESRLLHRRYAACCESGRWPGYASKIRVLSLPGWGKTDEEDE